MNERKRMTLQEFNDTHYISVMVSAFQDAQLKKDRDELDYGAIDEVSENLNYVLFSNGKEVLQMDGSSDAAFIDLILEKYDIIDLEE